jgi:hypothetical protein
MEIEVFSEVGKTRPAFVYYVDGQKAGTRVADVLRVVGNKLPAKLVREACADAKLFGRSFVRA